MMRAAAVVLGSVLCAALAMAQIPRTLSYQGVLLDASGQPLPDGEYEMEFRLYEVATGGAPLFVESQRVRVEHGVVSTLIGLQRPLTLPFDRPYYLGVALGGGAELTPRVPLTAVPYAFRAVVADSLRHWSASDTAVRVEAHLLLGSSASAVRELRLQEAAINGQDYVGLRAPSNVPNSIVWTLPATDGTPGQVLSTDGNGNLRWTSVAGGGSWSLSGNAITAGQFLGTTNAQPLVLRVANVERLRLTTRAQLEVLNSGQSVFLGEGAGAAQDITTPRNNTFVGYQAGAATTTGSFNVALGSRALPANTTGYGNIAVGYQALFRNSTGYDNTAVGSAALFNNADGARNTALGFQALYRNAGGLYNTAVGAYALEQNVSGSSNTAVGYQAGPNGADYTNTTALGYGVATTASNQVRIGNSDVTSIGGYVSWSTISDARIKLDVREDVPGLDFIRLLRPVNYRIDPDRVRQLTGAAAAGGLSTASEAAELVRTGFLAQEVEHAARRIGFPFGGIDPPKNERDLYGLRYAEFVAPLVKAVQELDAENQQLRQRLAWVEEQLQHLREQYQQLRSLLQGMTIGSEEVGQKRPK
jgi:hypothetical protein